MSTQRTCETALAPATTQHEHGWIVESRHQTSEGTVVYVRCGECRARRVDLQPHPLTPPVALSRATPAESSAERAR